MHTTLKEIREKVENMPDLSDLAVEANLTLDDLNALRIIIESQTTDRLAALTRYVSLFRTAVITKDKKAMKRITEKLNSKYIGFYALRKDIKANLSCLTKLGKKKMMSIAQEQYTILNDLKIIYIHLNNLK